MSLNFLPHEPNNTKDMIILILAEDFPLTLMKIKNLISKRYKKNLTYQGVYKEINKLIEDKIIVKENKEYLLDKEWILRINKSSEKIYLNYNNKNDFSKIFEELKEEGSSKTIILNSIFEVDELLIKLLKNYNNFFQTNKPILMHYSNNTWPYLYPRELFEIKNSLDNEFYCLVNIESEIRNWAYDFKKRLGYKVQRVEQRPPYWNFDLIGDFIFHYIFDKKILKELRDFLEKTNKIKNIDFEELNSIINKKGVFKFIVMNNSEIKENLLNEIKTHFN